VDKELKDALTKLLEGQNKLAGEVGNLKGEVQKNSIKLESVEKKIDTIAEVQKNHMDQNEKAHKEIIKPLDEKVDVIGLAVKNTSKDMKELKDKFDKVEKVTIQNTYDVAYLKSAK
jgi:chromosome segregation ATPase